MENLTPERYDSDKCDPDAPPPYNSHLATSRNPSPQPSFTSSTSHSPHSGPSFRLKVTKNSAFDREYIITHETTGHILYTVERHERIFSSKPELYIRHPSGLTIAEMHISISGRAEINMVNFEKPVAYKMDRSQCFPSYSWRVEHCGRMYEIKHTRSGMDKFSTKHLKMLDEQGEMVCRWESMYSRSAKSLGKLEIWAEEEGWADVGKGEGQRWIEWCLSVMVTLAEIEKRLAQASAAYIAAT